MMSTRAAAFVGKISNLRDGLARIQSGQQPQPTCLDLANMMKYFSQTLHDFRDFTDIENIPLYASEKRDRLQLIKTLPNFDYCGLYRALCQLVDILSLIPATANGLDQLGSNLMTLLKSLVPFLDQSDMETMPYLVASLFMPLPSSLHKEIMDTLCFNLLPFIIDQQQKKTAKLISKQKLANNNNNNNSNVKKSSFNYIKTNWQDKHQQQQTKSSNRGHQQHCIVRIEETSPSRPSNEGLAGSGSRRASASEVPKAQKGLQDTEQGGDDHEHDDGKNDDDDDDDDDEYGMLSVTSILLIALHYTNDPMHHSQLVECLMKLKSNVFEDLIYVIAYGTTRAKCPAAELLFRYWPDVGPKKHDRKNNSNQFAKSKLKHIGWTPSKCQNRNCPNVIRNQNININNSNNNNQSNNGNNTGNNNNINNTNANSNLNGATTANNNNNSPMAINGTSLGGPASQLSPESVGPDPLGLGGSSGGGTSSGCGGANDDEAVKMCLDFKLSLSLGGVPPPMLLCLDCAEGLIRHHRGVARAKQMRTTRFVDDPTPAHDAILPAAADRHNHNDHEADDHFSNKFIDLLLPMEKVAGKCENKACKSTDKLAIGTCFDFECANFNRKRPVRYCRACFQAKHEPNESNGYDVTLATHMRHSSMMLCVLDSDERVTNFVEAIISLLKEAAPADKPLKDGDRHLRQQQQQQHHGSHHGHGQGHGHGHAHHHLSSANSSHQLGGAAADPMGINSSGMATEERQLISQYGIWLMTGLCDKIDSLSDELLGRLLGMLFQWFHFTACLPDDQAGSALEKLKGECIKGWIMMVKEKRLDLFISCLLPHPIDCSKIGGHWELWPDNAHQIKEGFKRLLCLVPYDIITDDVWDEIMPYWMECFRHEVPENELSELKILLSKVFDPELSPLGFETKQMYNFISSRFEDPNNCNQEQTLYWLQIITMLEIPIPIDFLFKMLKSGVSSLTTMRQIELNKLKINSKLANYDSRMPTATSASCSSACGASGSSTVKPQQTDQQLAMSASASNLENANPQASNLSLSNSGDSEGNSNEASVTTSGDSGDSDDVESGTGSADGASLEASEDGSGATANSSQSSDSSRASSRDSSRELRHRLSKSDHHRRGHRQHRRHGHHHRGHHRHRRHRKDSSEGRTAPLPAPPTQQERQAQARAAFSAKMMQQASLLNAGLATDQDAASGAAVKTSLGTTPSSVSSEQGVLKEPGEPDAKPGSSASSQRRHKHRHQRGSRRVSGHQHGRKSHHRSTSGSSSKRNRADTYGVGDQTGRHHHQNSHYHRKGKKPKLRLHLSSSEQDASQSSYRVDNNLVCYILMLDITLKQIDLQEIISHRGLDGKEAQQAIELLNAMISSPWIGKHTCCDSMPVNCINNAANSATKSSASAGSGASSSQPGGPGAQQHPQQGAGVGWAPKTPSASHQRSTTTTTTTTATETIEQETVSSNIHAFAHCAEGFENEDSYESCVFCEVISTFHQLGMFLIEFFSPLIEVSICEISPDAADGEFSGQPDYSRIGLDHLEFALEGAHLDSGATEASSAELQQSGAPREPASATEPCEAPSDTLGQPHQAGYHGHNKHHKQQQQHFTFKTSEHSTSGFGPGVWPLSPGYLGPSLRPQVLESLPNELRLAYNLLVQFHQYQTPDIVSQLLRMIKLISLHSQVLSKAAKSNWRFITWCQHNMLIGKLWSLCELESSEIARTCVPLLLHCITLPWGVRLFRDLVERDFQSDNWLSRFRAVERVVTIAHFCEPTTIKNSTLLQSTMASAFCYVCRCLDDIEAIVAQRALVSLDMMKTSSIKLLLWCLEVQFDYIIIDRPIILKSVFQLYNHLRDRRFLTWEFFLNRFDTIFLEAQIYLQQTGEIPSFTMQDLKNTNTKSEIYQKKIMRAREALSEAHHSRSLSARFAGLDARPAGGCGSSTSEAEQLLVTYKQSVVLQRQMDHQNREQHSNVGSSFRGQPLTPTPPSSASAGGGGGSISTGGHHQQGSRPPLGSRLHKDHSSVTGNAAGSSPARRVLQHGVSTSSRYQTVAYLTSQSLLRRKNSKFMAQLAMQSVPPSMMSSIMMSSSSGSSILPEKLQNQHLPNTFVDGDGSKLNEIAQENHVFSVIHRLCDEDRDTNHSLVFLMMQFYSKPDPSHPQNAKNLNRIHQIVIRHLNILMGYSIARKNFLIGAANLRLLPVFNAFLTSLPKVLDFNYSLGNIMLDSCLPALIYCPAPDDVQFECLKRPKYSLWLLNPLARHSWLMSVMTFLYKYQFNQPQHEHYVIQLMWIVINTLESHLSCSTIDTMQMAALDRCLLSMRDHQPLPVATTSGEPAIAKDAQDVDTKASENNTLDLGIGDKSMSKQADLDTKQASPNRFSRAASPSGSGYQVGGSIRTLIKAETSDRLLRRTAKQAVTATGSGEHQVPKGSSQKQKLTQAGGSSSVTKINMEPTSTGAEPATGSVNINIDTQAERLLPIGLAGARGETQPGVERLLPIGTQQRAPKNAHDEQVPVEVLLLGQDKKLAKSSAAPPTPKGGSDKVQGSDRQPQREPQQREPQDTPSITSFKSGKSKAAALLGQAGISSSSPLPAAAQALSLSWKGSGQGRVDFAANLKLAAPSLLNEQLAQINRHSLVQEFSDKDLSMCLVILETFIHQEPSMAAQMMPNILRLVARYSSAVQAEQSGSSGHLVGGSMYVARQFIRVALHDLMDNNVFLQIFTSHFTNLEFYKSMATALMDSPDLNQLTPLSKLFEDLNKQKNLPQMATLVTILENVATYFECIIAEATNSQQYPQSTWQSLIVNWENFLRKLILAIPRYTSMVANASGCPGATSGAPNAPNGAFGANVSTAIVQAGTGQALAPTSATPAASGAPAGTGQAQAGLGGVQNQCEQSASSLIMSPIMRIILSTTKIAHLASCKTIVDPYSKIVCYAALNSQFKYEHLLEINHNCCRLYSRDREKYLIQRTLAYELIQVIKFRFFILEKNLLMLLLFILQDVGGILPPKLMYESLKLDQSILNQADSYITNISECLRQYISELLEFITDVHAISRINDNLIGSQPSCINRDSFGGHVKAAISQYLALELSLNSGLADNRTILRFMPWLYTSPSPQQGPREFIECVSHIRQLSWIILGALQHSTLMKCGLSGAQSSSSSGLGAAQMPAGTSQAAGGSGLVAGGVSGATGAVSSSTSAAGGAQSSSSAGQQTSSNLQQGSLQQQPQQGAPQGALQPSGPQGSGSHAPQTGAGGAGSVQQQAQSQAQHPSGMLSSGGGVPGQAIISHQSHSNASPVNCQPIPIDKNGNIAEHVQVILAGFAEQSKESVLHMSGLFHAFLLCQLWTMYCEKLCSQQATNSEQYQYCQSTLDDFWAKITPGVLRLVGHSRVMSEMVSTHFLQLIESLIESNSSILIRYLPMWNSVFYSYKRRNKSRNLAVRLQKCIDWQPPDLNEFDIEQNNKKFLNWLEKVQYKMSHIEIQSSQAAPFYLT